MLLFTSACFYYNLHVGHQPSVVFVFVAIFVLTFAGLEPLMVFVLYVGLSSSTSFELVSDGCLFCRWLQAIDGACPIFLNIFVLTGILENFIFFANWNPLADNAPRPKGQRKSTRKKNIVLQSSYLRGGRFFPDAEPKDWKSLKSLMPDLVYNERLENIIAQCGNTALKPPTKGVRATNTLEAAGNVKTIKSNFENLPPSLRSWISDVQCRFGSLYNVAGYEQEKSRKLLSDATMHYSTKKDKSHHYLLHGDLAKSSVFAEIDAVPGVKGNITACHMQLPVDDAGFNIPEKLGVIIDNVLKLDGLYKNFAMLIWCTDKQAADVLETMSKNHRFKKVESHIAWITGGCENKSTKAGVVIPQDYYRGYVGYAYSDAGEPASGSLMKIGQDRTRMHVAPSVGSTKLKYCSGALGPGVPYSFFKQHCNTNDWILDLMCGLGSAAVAAAGLLINSISVDCNMPMVRFIYVSVDCF